MVPKEIKDKFLEVLRKTPILQLACERSGVSRASLYRWKKKSQAFAKEVDAAIAEGIGFITDIAEGQLIQAIKEKNITALIFWLKNHHEKYGNKLEIKGNLNVSERLTHEQEALVKKALMLASKSYGKTSTRPLRTDKES
jgi:hypothetical protein